MKTHITLLALLFVIFNIISLNASGEKADRNQRSNIRNSPDVVNRDIPVHGGNYHVDTVMYDKKGNEHRYKYTYNENRKITAVTRYSRENGDWMISSRSDFSYDKKGNRILHLWKKWENEELVDGWKRTYTYDKDGNLLNVSFKLLEKNTKMQIDDR